MCLVIVSKGILVAERLACISLRAQMPCVVQMPVTATGCVLLFGCFFFVLCSERCRKVPACLQYGFMYIILVTVSIHIFCKYEGIPEARSEVYNKKKNRLFAIHGSCVYSVTLACTTHGHNENFMRVIRSRLPIISYCCVHMGQL